MSVIKNLFRKPKPPPEWADFLTGKEYEAFLDLICAHFQARLEDHPECVGSQGSLIAIPHRHVMLCYPIEDIRVVLAVNGLIPVVNRMYHEGPGSISPCLYWYDGTQFMNLPYGITEKQLQFMPPERFVELMNRLADSERP